MIDEQDPQGFGFVSLDSYAEVNAKGETSFNGSIGIVATDEQSLADGRQLLTDLVELSGGSISEDKSSRGKSFVNNFGQNAFDKAHPELAGDNKGSHDWLGVPAGAVPPPEDLRAN